MKRLYFFIIFLGSYKRRGTVKKSPSPGFNSGPGMGLSPPLPGKKSHISLNQSHIGLNQSQPYACSTAIVMPGIDSAVPAGESGGGRGIEGAGIAPRPFLGLPVTPTRYP
jgi:hypothetical protein